MKIQNTISKDCIIDVTAISLILISLFLNFFVSTGYSILSKEVIILFFMIVFISAMYVYFISPDSHLVKCGIYSVLIIIFIDFQFEFLKWRAGQVFAVLFLAFVALWLVRKHVSVILLTVFATINIATVIVPLGPAVEKLIVAEEYKGRPEAGLPNVVHLILDEHIGIEGIPTDIPGGKETRDTLLAFFQKYGFHIFGGAYSKYLDSNDSISSLLNFASYLPQQRLYYADESHVAPPFKYVLKSNQYFQEMRSAGYRIRVYQSTYMDYCQEIPIRVDDCFIYYHSSIKRSALNSLDSFQRMELITGMYLTSYSKTSWFMRQFRRFYKHVGKSFDTTGKTTFSWSEWDGRVSPISTMPAIDKLISDLESGPKGILYFAHLLLPHYPYIYDRTCNIRTPVFDWKNRTSPAYSAESRAIRYSLYFEQIHCTLFRLQAIFERMKAANVFRDATIIVHSDHGSKIVITLPIAKFEDRLTAEDLVDGFSTLFAVKAPSQTTGYDREMRPIEEIFQQVIHGSTDAPSSPEEHYVYLRKEGGGWSQIRLPTIPLGVE